MDKSPRETLQAPSKPRRRHDSDVLKRLRRPSVPVLRTLFAQWPGITMNTLVCFIEDFPSFQTLFSSQFLQALTIITEMIYRTKKNWIG